MFLLRSEGHFNINLYIWNFLRKNYYFLYLPILTLKKEEEWAIDVFHSFIHFIFCIYALAYNALQLPFFFFFFFSFSTGFWTDCLKLFSKRFMINYQGRVWPRSDSFLGHTKKFFLKSVPEVVICDACGTWHGVNTVTSIHSIQKSTRNSKKLRNKLVSGWQKIQGSKQIEIELISKKVWRKRKGKIFRLRSWLLLHVKKYKSCCWRTFVRKCS